jgi:predicted dehydrogenase
MIEAVEAKNLKWSIAHQKRMTPIVQHTKKLVFEDGIVGEVLEVRGRGKEDARAGGEDLIVLGTHIMDLMNFFLGPAIWCESDITVEGRAPMKEDAHDVGDRLGLVVGDCLHATYGYSGGTKGYFGSKLNSHGNKGRWGLDIYGTLGVVTIRMETVPEVYLLREPSWAPGKSGKQWEELPDLPPMREGNPNWAMNSYAVDDLLAAVEEDREPQVSLQSGRAAHELIQAANESFIQGGRVAIPLVERRHPLVRWTS